jgi:hypothetical protein
MGCSLGNDEVDIGPPFDGGATGCAVAGSDRTA